MHAVPEDPEDADLEDLLAPVLALEEDAQEGALAALCAVYPHYAGRLRGCFGILRRFGLASADGRPPVATSIDREPAPGERFGPFLLCERIGRGGMGVVYLAEDTELGRPVALKVIRPEFLDSDRARERFRREVAAAAKLDHPGLCAVHRAGEVDGQPYLVMRYVRGESLEAQLRQARAGGHGAWTGSSGGRTTGSSGARLRAADLRPALQLIEMLARAVHVAHEAGLVHRDIKPANVMVTLDGQPVLMDFGLVRDAAAGSAALTQTSDVVGTPAYMAPEQVRAGPTDRRTDVHALGVLLYECLTLRLPYVGGDREQLYRSILQTEPIEVQRLQPAASRDLVTVVQKAMAKEPPRRYATALALAEDLRAVLEGRPTAARPPGLLVRSWFVVRRHRAASAVAIAVVAGLLASLSFLGRSIASERRFRAIAMIHRAEEVRPEDPDRALAILQEALGLSPEPEVVAAIHDLLPDLQDWTLLRADPSDRWQALEPSPSGRFVLATRYNKPAMLLRADGTWSDLPWQVVPQKPAFAFTADEQSLWAWCMIDGEGGHLVRFDLRARVPVADLRLQVPLTRVTSLACSGDLLLVTGRDAGFERSRARLYNENGNMLQVELPMPLRSNGGAFLADGRIALPGGIWSRDGTKLVDLQLPGGESRFVRVASDRIAIASTTGLCIYDDAGRVLGRKERDGAFFGNQTTGIDWSPDGRHLAASFRDGKVWLLDREGGMVDAWSVSSNCSVRFAGTLGILTADSEGRATLWDFQGRQLHRLLAHRWNAEAAPFADGSQVLTAGWDGCVRLWRPGTSAPGLPLRENLPHATVARIANGIVVAAADGRLLALDAAGEVANEGRTAPGSTIVQPHRDGRSVWLLDVDRALLRAWEPGKEPSEPLDPGYGAMNPPVCLADMEGGPMLLANASDVAMMSFDITSGAHRRLATRASRVAATATGNMAVGFGSQRIFVVDRDAAVLWSKPDPVARGLACALAVTGDGRRAVVGFQDGAIVVWDLVARCILEDSPTHSESVYSCAISPDGQTVASAGSQHLVVRRVDCEGPLLSWRSRGSAKIHGLAFLDDHALVSAGRADGLLRFWWWEPEQLQRALERIRVQRR